MWITIVFVSPCISGSDICKKGLSLIELSYYFFYESYIQDHILFVDQDVLFSAKEISLKVLLISLFSCGIYFYFIVNFVLYLLNFNT